MTYTDEPKLNIGQTVRFTPSGKVIYDAQIVTREWSMQAGTWEYRLRGGYGEFGPYTYEKLKGLMRDVN